MFLNLNILSLKKKKLFKKIKFVCVPGEVGYFSIYINHVPLLTFLNSGLIIVNTKNNNTEYFFISQGILEVQSNIVNILTNYFINIKYLNEYELINKKNKIENKHKNIKNFDFLGQIKNKYSIILNKLKCIHKVQKIKNK